MSEETKAVIVEHCNVEVFQLLELPDKISSMREMLQVYVSWTHVLSLWVYSSQEPVKKFTSRFSGMLCKKKALVQAKKHKIMVKPRTL